MGSALGWELKVQLPLFTSPLLHPLTAPSCHIVRLKVQTSPSDSRPTWKHLCGIMAASSDPVAALSSSRTCVDKALQMTIGWWQPPQRRSQTSEYTLNTQPIALRLKSYYLKVNPCIIHNECIMFLLLPTSPNIRVYINTHLPRTLYNLLW